jgi:hypothetical protein
MDERLLEILVTIVKDYVHRNGGGVIGRDVFERILRDGFYRISQRTDLDDLADKGLQVISSEDETAISKWFNADGDYFESVCRMFSVYAAQGVVELTGSVMEPGFPVELANKFADFHDKNSPFDTKTPERVRQAALVKFWTVKNEIDRNKIVDIELVEDPVPVVA